MLAKSRTQITSLTVISDPGIDDLVALVLIDKLLPYCSKTLVSTYGNNSATATATNARAFVAHVGGSWQYRQGATKSLNHAGPAMWLDENHGHDGIWGIQPPRNFGIEESSKNTEPSTIISLGPLTEVAMMIRDIPPMNFFMMGGAFNASGPELNIAMDAVSAKQVIENSKIANFRIVPADSAQSVSWSLADIEAIPDTTATNCWLKKLLLTGFRKGVYSSEKPFILYDPLAVYLCLFPESVDWVENGVSITGTGEQSGQSLLTGTNTRRKIILDVYSAVQAKDLARRIYGIVFGKVLP